MIQIIVKEILLPHVNYLVWAKKKISKLNDQPAVKGQIMEVLGNIYGLLSYHQKADSLLKMAMTLKQDLYKTPDPGLASIFFSLAANKQILGEYDTTKV